jgi:hypothetical protein
MTRNLLSAEVVVFATIVFMSFVNVGCRARHDAVEERRFDRVHHGMAIEVVERLLGPPSSRVVDGKDQMLVYAVDTMNHPPGGPNLRIEGYYIVCTNGYVQSCGLGYRKK